MKVLPLVFALNPLLKKISAPVTKVDDELRDLMKDMVSTMHQEKGIGLAAVQVGILKRVLVIDIDYEIEDHDHSHHNCEVVHVKNSKPRYFVNPEIVKFSQEESSYKEGCLSFPGARAEVARPKKVTVKFLDYFGQEKEEEFEGILATCIQHEMDHLNGITFVDHISNLKRDLIIKKMKKLGL